MEQEQSLLVDHGFQILRVLGQGGFGRVYQIFNEKFGVIAAKIMKEDDFDFGKWQTGIRLTKNALNPFVLKYIESFQTKDYAVILMEYANMGGLDSLITSNKDIPMPLIRVIMKQILEGLRLMHEKGLIHRDIKEQNILLHSPFKSGRVILKICDFGLVKSQKNIDQSTLVSVVGTLPYQPPELILGNEDGEYIKEDARADIWAAGIILHWLLTHSFPFKSPTLQAINQFMIRKTLTRPESVKDNIAWDLITKLLTFDRKDRISSSDALNHLFFAGDQAKREISPLSIQLAQAAQQSIQRGDRNITQYDADPSFSLHINDIRQFVNRDPEAEMAQIQQQRKISTPAQPPQSNPKQFSSSQASNNFISTPIMSTLEPNRQITLPQSQPQSTFTGGLQEPNSYIPILPFPDDVKIDKDIFTCRPGKISTILFDPVINKGIVRIEILNVKDLDVQFSLNIDFTLF
ncbi:MAG: putative calcium/calmodulin-dependent protein kinase [Streblomastix strix]|uniref:Putative calcium/calmodulin-dependent protein kinase n=1 Tax=Streblomastix strix TaxID=222440 RepID=A0A5J4WB61_9EUKA|nr:MAG: putative calcium/calmodulin-dependent protein kinase [Streblomastix strix]